MHNKMTLRPMTPADAQPVMDIFNYYIENSFAAYPQDRLPVQFYNMLLGSYQGYPNAVALDDDKVVGFGGLRAYNPMPTFNKTAEISYFLHPSYTSKGIGNMMLDHFIQAAREKGLETLLASISSLNEASLHFHEKHGFTRCGTLKRIGCKNGTYFDVVYMQRFI